MPQNSGPIQTKAPIASPQLPTQNSPSTLAKTQPAPSGTAAQDPKPQSTGASEKAIVFSKPNQIIEILAEAEKLKLPVLLKYTNDGRAVRGFIERADIKGENGLRIGGISAAGDAVLASYDVIKVEFVLLSKKLYFVTKIRARTTSRILVNVPEKLYAVERRRNARFTIPNGVSAFMEFEGLNVDLSRFDAPFNPDFTFANKTNTIRLKLDDISLGGTALSTRFPAIAETLKPTGDEFISAKLFLPKSLPIQIPVAVRWSKKSTIRILSNKHEEMCRILTSKITDLGFRPADIQFNEIYHRYGIQFAEISNELDGALRDFIHVCQTAESV